MSMCALPRRPLAGPFAALLLLCACGPANAPADGAPPEANAQADAEPADAPREGPPQARWDVVDSLRETAAMQHDPSDGGGRAWLVRDGQPPVATVGQPDRFTLVYEAGPLGIASGGTLYLQVSPFWEWSQPQTLDRERPGYTEVTASAPDIEFDAGALDQQLLGIQITGRALVEGDRITIVYGAGPAGAYPDLYAERDSQFWFAVDGNGDGQRSFLVDSPTIDVVAGPPALLVATLPTLARPGESFRATFAVLDAFRNTNVEVDGDLVLEVPDGIELPERTPLAEGEGGRLTLVGTARAPGVYRVRAHVGDLSAETNPLLVSAEGPRVLWGDLHGHTNFADGTGVPEDYFVYARDVSALDVAAITEHDHWGVLPLVEHPPYWQEILRQTRRFHEPGRFVTLPGFEWTNWIHGHRHVLFFEDDDVPDTPIDSVDPATDSPQELWQALGDREALTFAHHSAGGPIATNWEIPPDPHFEPVTEIVSVHGNSESPDAPGYIYAPVPGNSVRDALDLGYRLGFIGSGDSHDGHPGADRRDGPRGGLAAILSEERTRESVLSALRARRVYATNGPRILLRFALGSHGMGSIVPIGADAKLDDVLFVQVIAVSPLERVELVRSGEVVDGVLTEGRLEVALHREVEGLAPGEYLYVRAIQEDGGMAWSSPIWITE
jgi:hypothetical protein